MGGAASGLRTGRGVALSLLKPVPVKVGFHITYRCNLTCGYCGRREAESNELSEQGVRDLLDHYRARGTVFWSWNGGEALVRPDIEGHVAYAAQLGFRQLLISNCTLLPRKRSVLDHLQLLEVSLDGPPDVHDQVRGRASFQSVEKGVALARDHGVPVQVLVVLTESSVPHIEWLLRWVRSAGANLAVQPVHLHREGPGPSIDHWKVGPQRIAEVARYLESERHRGGVAASASYLRLLAGERAAPDCRAGRTFLNVRPDGSEALCCSRLHETAPGPLPDARGCRECVLQGPQETNLLLTPGGLVRAGVNALRGELPWSR